MEGMANAVCPKCNGRGKYFEIGTGGNAEAVSCTNCGGTGIVEVKCDMERSFIHSTSPNYHSLIDFNEPRKTLLDEFAMSAMEGVLANNKFERLRQETMDGVISEDKQTEALVSVCYDYAAAMLAEKLRRQAVRN
jgi:hypothetical protein